MSVKEDFSAVKYTAWWKWVNDSYNDKRIYCINNLITAKDIQTVAYNQGCINALDAFMETITVEDMED